VQRTAPACRNSITTHDAIPVHKKKRRNPEIAPSTLLQRELAHTGRMAQPA
jgi:hypothetical protein